MDAIASVLSRAYPPSRRSKLRRLIRFENFLLPVALLAVHPVSYCPTIGPPQALSTPRGFSGWGTQLYAQKCARQTKCERVVPDS